MGKAKEFRDKHFKKQPVPEVGKRYWFFDDGKISMSRLYQAICKGVMEFKDVPDKVKDAIIFEINHYDWIFNSDSNEDKVIRCSIKDYYENDIWFIRAKDGGWFSVNVDNNLEGGRLDVDGHFIDILNSYND